MNAYAHPSKVLNLDEFSTIVRRRRDGFASRYGEFALDMSRIGEPDLERVFRSLIDDVNVDIPPQPSRTAVETYTPDATAVAATERTGMRGLWSAYSIWAFAVRNEIKLFEELTSLNIPINSEQLRSALAIEARACLDRAARYRIQRRLAFHADRLATKTAQFPDVRRIDTLDDFAHVAIAIERYFLAFMRRSGGSKSTLADVIGITEGAIADLERTMGSTEMPKRLRNALKRLERASRDPRISVGASADMATKIALEANRVFDFYDRVFETSQDPQVTEAAQHMAACVIERLHILNRLQSAA